MEIRTLIEHARGDVPSDILLRNARVVDVLGGEIVTSDVAIYHSRIVGLGTYDATETIDLGGAYVAPGFIDAHVHIESAMVPPGEYARTVAPLGTTTVVTDPHEIANVLGLDGIRYMFESAKYGPLSMYVMLSACVPASDLATSGAVLHWYDLASLRSDPWVLGLAEVMNFPGVITRDDGVLDKLRSFAGAAIDGHAPRLGGRALQAYVAAGIQSDHECTTPEEAREKLRLGMTIFIREGSVARNLSALLPLVTPANHHRMCFCTDDRQPSDLLDRGHIDGMIRAAIDGGLDPLMAIRMATWNTASHFRLWDRGAVTPGRRADLVVFDDLRAPRPRLVFRGGRLVARDGAMAVEPPPGEPRRLRGTVNVNWDAVDFRIPAEGRRARVIGLVEGDLATREVIEEIPSRDGVALSNPEGDLLQIAVVERHLGSGATGKGFVSGLGLRRGALASSVAHDHHNIIVAGADDESMRTATRRVAALQGGWVVADGRAVLAEVPLPIAGLMSADPLPRVRTQIDAVDAAARALGTRVASPCMALSFLGLEVIPALKLTDKGLVDVERFQLVPLWVS